jgi:pyruvate/2-oxoglutarate dehydrogenase complex dihydrolipoamide acyltransferase (E2) component
MSTFTTITVPDIGDFKHIPVIEILVKAGDRVSRDSPLIVLESDKATLDVPSPQEGTIRELKIAVGDRVSVGTVILTLEDVAKESPASAQAPTTLTPPTIPSTSAFTSVSTPPAQAPTPVNAGDALAFPRSALRIVQEAAPPADPRRSPHAPGESCTDTDGRLHHQFRRQDVSSHTVDGQATAKNGVCVDFNILWPQSGV